MSCRQLRSNGSFLWRPPNFDLIPSSPVDFEVLKFTVQICDKVSDMKEKHEVGFGRYARNKEISSETGGVLRGIAKLQ